jgi:hypothetical protein
MTEGCCVSLRFGGAHFGCEISGGGHVFNKIALEANSMSVWYAYVRAPREFR